MIDLESQQRSNPALTEAKLVYGLDVPLVEPSVVDQETFSVVDILRIRLALKSASQHLQSS